MNFGEKIKYRRQELGLSQTDIAKKIGTTKQNVSLWENNKLRKRMSIFKVEELARVLKVTPMSLITDGAPLDEKNYINPTKLNSFDNELVNLVLNLNAEEKIILYNQLIEMAGRNQ